MHCDYALYVNSAIKRSFYILSVLTGFLLICAVKPLFSRMS